MRDGVRLDLQRGAADALRRHGRLLAQWPTGLGKSGILLEYLKAHPDTGRVLVAVPETNNVRSWRDEFARAGVPSADVTFTCYASLRKLAGTSWDVVVYDECPHLDTAARSEAAASIAAGRVLALGAAVSPEECALLDSLYGPFLRSRISLAEAAGRGLLPLPRVHVLHASLAAGEREEYDALSRECSDAMASYELTGSPWARRRMLAAGVRRKRFLGSLKTGAMRRVASALEARGLRFLFFCSSVAQAEELGGAHAFTSRTKHSMQVLDDFNEHRIDSLYAVGKLVEGQNLRDIDAGVLGQLDGTDRLSIQKCGRILRSEEPEVYALVFDGTKDTSFLRSLTCNLPDGCVTHESLDSLPA